MMHNKPSWMDVAPKSILKWDKWVGWKSPGRGFLRAPSLLKNNIFRQAHWYKSDRYSEEMCNETAPGNY